MANPSSGGRNNSIHIPKVGGGNAIRPRHINKLGEAIDRNSLGSGIGYTHHQTSSGTILNIRRTFHRAHPWFCYRLGELMAINVGHFYLSNKSKLFPVGNSGQIQTANSPASNIWVPNSSFAWASDITYGDSDKSYGLHMEGSELFFDIDDMKYLTNMQMQDGADPLTTVADAGLYYITIAKWSGRQLSNPDDNQDIGSWNDYSTAMKDKLVPCMKWASLDDMFAVTGTIYPIATIDEYDNIFQGVASDIFHQAAEAAPLTVIVSPSSTDTDVFDISIVAGTVCNVMPTYGEGNYIWEESDLTATKEDLKTKMHYVVLKCTALAEDEFSGGRFPDKVQAEVLTDYDPSNWDKDDAGYLLIACFKGVMQKDSQGNETGFSISINQLVTGSVWAERRKFSDKPASYYFYRLSTN